MNTQNIQDLHAYYTQNNSGILNEKFCLIKTIGDGGTAKVKLAYDLLNKDFCAIKVLKSLNEKDMDMVVTEVETMSKVDHANVLKMIEYGQGAVVDGNGNIKGQCLYIALQLAQEETLFDFITQIDGAPFSENLAVKFFEEFILGLQAIHLSGSCHRDIKCENIFLDKSFVLKIADFGFSAPIQGKVQGKSGKLYTFLGTEGQIAPEILKLKPNEGYSGQLVDVFNAGIILFCMVLQKMPFASAADNDHNYKWVVRDNAEEFWRSHENQGTPVSSLSTACRELIYAMLSRQPESRPSLLEILNDDWITNTPKHQNIKEEFANRKAYIIKLQQEAERIALERKEKQTASVKKRAMKSGDLGLEEARNDRRYYPYHDMILTQFQVFNDAEETCKLITDSIMVLNEKYYPSESDTKFKIKTHAENDDGECEISIRIMKKQNANIFVEFQKQSGNQSVFMEYYTYIKKAFEQQ